MNNDLKIIKKKYGENMMKLCRNLFPTLLDEPGFLSKIMLDNFYPSHSLYYDIKNNCLENEFKSFIYSFLNDENVFEESKKTPKELFEEAGYDFFECKTEEDIQKFKKYYRRDEELCTFKGSRLKDCYVFFVVKKNVSQIKRENFKEPKREDEYGTSVMSIQFTKDGGHTLSIKNRYNHSLTDFNPDATYNNNLENIAIGLTKSFENEYGLIQFNQNTNFEIPNYVRAKDGKYYKYNYEINNIYYCANNVIIDNYEVKILEKEKYILLDYFILDLQNKKLELYDDKINDSFIYSLKNIKKIDIINEGEEKNIIITCEEGKMNIKLDCDNRMIEIENNFIKEIEENYLIKNKYLLSLSLDSVKKIGNKFLNRNTSLLKISLEEVENIGDNFLEYNSNLEEIVLPNVEKIGRSFMFNCKKRINKIYMPKVKEIGNSFMFSNCEIERIELPEVEKIGNNFLLYNFNLRELILPKVNEIGDSFLENNSLLKKLYLPNVKKIGINFLKKNQILELLILPNLLEIGDGSLQYNQYLKEIIIPNIRNIGDNFLQHNRFLEDFCAIYLEKVGKNFLNYNCILKKLIVPNLKNINISFMPINSKIKYVNLNSLDKEYYNYLSEYIKNLIQSEDVFKLVLV